MEIKIQKQSWQSLQTDIMNVVLLFHSLSYCFSSSNFLYIFHNLAYIGKEEITSKKAVQLQMKNFLL
jgi:hypothetical protein